MRFDSPIADGQAIPLLKSSWSCERACATDAAVPAGASLLQQVGGPALASAGSRRNAAVGYKRVNTNDISMTFRDITDRNATKLFWTDLFRGELSGGKLPLLLPARSG